ncbi:hypothetical protein VTK56DRAFT_6253 [Thermocarpiscus australiensis]
MSHSPLSRISRAVRRLTKSDKREPSKSEAEATSPPVARSDSILSTPVTGTRSPRRESDGAGSSTGRDVNIKLEPKIPQIDGHQSDDENTDGRKHTSKPEQLEHKPEHENAEHNPPPPEANATNPRAGQSHSPGATTFPPSLSIASSGFQESVTTVLPGGAGVDAREPPSDATLPLPFTPDRASSAVPLPLSVSSTVRFPHLATFPNLSTAGAGMPESRPNNLPPASQASEESPLPHPAPPTGSDAINNMVDAVASAFADIPRYDHQESVPSSSITPDNGAEAKSKGGLGYNNGEADPSNWEYLPGLGISVPAGLSSSRPPQSAQQRRPPYPPLSSDTEGNWPRGRADESVLDSPWTPYRQLQPPIRPPPGLDVSMGNYGTDRMDGLGDSDRTSRPSYGHHVDHDLSGRLDNGDLGMDAELERMVANLVSSPESPVTDGQSSKGKGAATSSGSESSQLDMDAELERIAAELVSGPGSPVNDGRSSKVNGPATPPWEPGTTPIYCDHLVQSPESYASGTDNPEAAGSPSPGPSNVTRVTAVHRWPPDAQPGVPTTDKGKSPETHSLADELHAAAAATPGQTASDAQSSTGDYGDDWSLPRTPRPKPPSDLHPPSSPAMEDDLIEELILAQLEGAARQLGRALTDEEQAGIRTTLLNQAPGRRRRRGPRSEESQPTSIHSAAPPEDNNNATGAAVCCSPDTNDTTTIHPAPSPASTTTRRPAAARPPQESVGTRQDQAEKKKKRTTTTTTRRQQQRQQRRRQTSQQLRAALQALETRLARAEAQHAASRAGVQAALDGAHARLAAVEREVRVQVQVQVQGGVRAAAAAGGLGLAGVGSRQQGQGQGQGQDGGVGMGKGKGKGKGVDEGGRRSTGPEGGRNTPEEEDQGDDDDDGSDGWACEVADAVVIRERRGLGCLRVFAALAAFVALTWTVMEAVVHSRRLTHGYGPYINGGYNGLQSVATFGSWTAFCVFSFAISLLGVTSAWAVVRLGRLYHSVPADCVRQSGAQLRYDCEKHLTLLSVGASLTHLFFCTLAGLSRVALAARLMLHQPKAFYQEMTGNEIQIARHSSHSHHCCLTHSAGSPGLVQI